MGWVAMVTPCVRALLRSPVWVSQRFYSLQAPSVTPQSLYTQQLWVGERERIKVNVNVRLKILVSSILAILINKVISLAIYNPFGKIAKFMHIFWLSLTSLYNNSIVGKDIIYQYRLSLDTVRLIRLSCNVSFNW